MDLQPSTILPATSISPDAEAIWSDERALTWAQLEDRSRRFAQGLRAAGVAEGDCWAVLARNRAEWGELTIGNGRAGSRYVPLNWHLTANELAELLEDSNSKLLIVGPELADVGRQAAEVVGLDAVIVLGDEYEAWLAGQSSEPLEDCALGAPLQYTGGTTGRSKGVTRSDQGGRSSRLAEAYEKWGTLTGMPRGEQMMLCTPAYHALGGAVLRTALARGCPLVILDRWDPERTLATIDERKVVGTAMVPTQFIRLLKLDDSARAAHDVSSLEWVLHTAAPCPDWVKREMITWFGPVITELYGSSEGVGPVIATSQEWLERPGTVGRAMSVLELSILDDDGNDLGPGEVGTIYARRTDGAPEYHGDPEKTASMVRPDGRFTVGDVGSLDADGYLFLADRRVDLILVAGSNIYPAEIEGVLSRHPSVADVAVFGIPHADMGQEVKAVVEPVVGVTLDPAELLEFASEHLAPFKLPKTIDIVDALPREASGKLKKHKLRDPYWATDKGQKA